MVRRWCAVGLAVAAIGVIGVLVAACTSSSSATTQHPAVPQFTRSSPPTSARLVEPLKSCSTVALPAEVDGVVGHQLPGSANQVVGVAQPSIGRTGRLDCYFGIPAGQPVTAGAVSIGIATYSDEQSAQRRATLTVNTARQAGATSSNVRVGQTPAVLVAGQQNQELVLTTGNRTILVIVANGVLDQNKVGPALIGLAEKAMNAGT